MNRLIYSVVISRDLSSQYGCHVIFSAELVLVKCGPLKWADKSGEEIVCGGGGKGDRSKEMKHSEFQHEAFVTGRYMA